MYQARVVCPACDGLTHRPAAPTHPPDLRGAGNCASNHHEPAPDNEPNPPNRRRQPVNVTE
ncbi:hypothetical protein GCM10023080_072670 [Streptomyces pseudoechinosporeus]